MCPVRGEPMGSPVDASHSRTLLSLMYPSPLHDAMTLPFGEKTTQLTRSEWPVNVDWSSPDDAFQILTVLSQLPLAICLPSELKQTLTTRLLLKNTKSVPIYKRRHSIQGDGTYLWPARVDSTNPVSASHTTT